MVQEEPKLFPQASMARYEDACDPDNKPKHDWKASVPNDNEEARDQEREDGSVERVHGVRGQGEAQIHESRVAGKDSPPGPRLACFVHNAAVRTVEDPWSEAYCCEDPEPPEITRQDQRQGLQGSVLDATEFLPLLFTHIVELRVSS